MLALLQDVAANAQKEHPYFGRDRVQKLQTMLEDLGPDTTPHTRLQLLFNLGQAELDRGDLRPAIDHLTQAHRIAVDGDVAPALWNGIRFRLGVAYMRLGETENCCLRHLPESCILPFQPTALHTEEEGSRSAIRYFTELLDDTPLESDLHLTARWLLNIAYMTLGEYPAEVPVGYRIPEATFKTTTPFPRFQNVAPRLGLDTFSLSGGAIVDDFDNDHDLDLIISTWDTKGQMRFFANNGDGTFTERTEDAGLLGLLGGLNMVQADYDNDGHLDLLVLRGAWLGRSGTHPNSLLRNQGDGTFTDVTFESGLGHVHYPTQTAAWADYDLDGDLDLYVGNETSTGLTSDFLAPCQLFRNEGNGTFTDVASLAGVENLGYTKAVVWGDYDADRFPDLYVSNLKEPNRLYRNNGDGTFTDVAPGLGVTRPIRSFPVWFWDFDNDGVLDLFASSYTGTTNFLAAHHLELPVRTELSCLYRGNGQGGFVEVARELDLDEPILPMGSNFGDLDNDGYLDFYLGTGDPDYASLMPNLMYWNRAGKRFVNVTMAGGFGHLQKGHGIAFADLDHDGDTDIFEQMGGAYPGDEYGDALYENPGFGNHWLGVRLVGTASNVSAIGTRIHARIEEAGTERSIYRHVTSGGSFGANPLRQQLGLGAATRVLRLEIFWPRTGRTQTFDDVPADQWIQIREGDDSYTTLDLKPFRLQRQAKR